MNHRAINFGVFLAYGTLEKIVLDVETWKKGVDRANLAILNPMAKLVFPSGMWIGRYCGATLIVKIGDPMV